MPSIIHLSRISINNPFVVVCTFQPSVKLGGGGGGNAARIDGGLEKMQFPKMHRKFAPTADDKLIMTTVSNGL